MGAMSLFPAKTRSPATNRWLPRYLLAAVLIRGANDGAGLGLVLLAVTTLESPTPGGAVMSGAAAGGILVAALNVPHVIGPWIGRVLDVGPDARRTLAIGFAGYGVALTAAALLLGRVPFVLVVGAALLAGCNGPLMAGGLSSRLAEPRALALDSATWGVATTAGPAAAALLAALSGPLGAVLTLSAVALAAGSLVLTLPPQERASRPERRPAVFGVMARDGNLRRIALCTVFWGLGTGTFPVAAPLLSTQLDRAAGAGGLMLSAYGFGSLLGSLLIAARPPAGSPIRRVSCYLAVMALAVAVAALAPTYALAVAGFGLVGLANGPCLAAVLEACRKFTPDGIRAQVFVTSSSLKVGAASLSGASAGLAGGAGGTVILLACSAAFVAAAAAPALDRLLSGSPSAGPTGTTAGCDSTRQPA
jgi:predicted MFS family arabinose efflux permease